MLPDDGRRPKHVGAIFIYVYFNVNFNVFFFKLIKVYLLVSELYICAICFIFY